MQFKVDDKNISIYCESDKDKLPLVVLNSFDENAQEVIKHCKQLNVDDFILVCVSNINWNDDMSPWYMDPLFKNEKPYMGKADDYLELLVNMIIPEVNKHIDKEIEYYAIAGYSLAGLFALYSAYKTDMFKTIMSASGSLWYPGFLDFVYNNKISSNVDKIYFSLGDKEANTRNELMSKVMDNTLLIKKYLGINLDTCFEENEGNHFKDPELRIAKGISNIIIKN